MLGLFAVLPFLMLPAVGLMAPAGGASRLPVVSSWAYVLQGHGDAALPVDALAASAADLLVVEPSVGERPMSREELTRLQGPKHRPVLAYLSIGEAESYRTYWRAEWKTPASRPAFLGPENPDWKGNYKVRYWQPEWQALIQARIVELADAGFDGAYLDIIDAYEFWGPGGAVGAKDVRKAAAADMVAFVLMLGEAARAKHPDFALVPQNGATILDEVPDAQAAAYLAAIDGIGAEDTFFYGEKEENNPFKPQAEVIAALGRYRAAGRRVLAVDYVTKPESAQKFVEAARKAGFAPYVGRRALDVLVSQP
jgi:cysteinyl-tRNA synthetase